MSHSFSLGDHFERFIDAEVKSGRYANASDVVRAGLRLLEDREQAQDQLAALIQDGMDGGPSRDCEEVLATLERKYRRQGHLRR